MSHLLPALSRNIRPGRFLPVWNGVLLAPYLVVLEAAEIHDTPRKAADGSPQQFFNSLVKRL